MIAALKEYQRCTAIFRFLEENKNSTLAQRLLQDGRSLCTTLLAIPDAVVQYQDCTPNLLSQIRLNCNPSVGGINMFLFAAEK